MKETLYDRVLRLATDSRMTIADVEKEAKLGNGSIRRWKKSIPSADKLHRVSNLFGVSMEVLLGYEETSLHDYRTTVVVIDKFTYMVKAENDEKAQIKAVKRFSQLYPDNTVFCIEANRLGDPK